MTDSNLLREGDAYINTRHRTIFIALEDATRDGLELRFIQIDIEKGKISEILRHGDWLGHSGFASNEDCVRL